MREVRVNPEYWTDARLIDCSLGAQRLYIGLYALGGGATTPKALKAIVFAGNDKIAEGDVEVFLGELSSRGLIDQLSDHDIRIVDEWRRPTGEIADALNAQTETVGNG